MHKQLAWGLIGGGEDSQIGSVHRIAARLDDLFALRAGALDADAGKARQFGEAIGIDPDRAYGSWQDMLAGEADRKDRVDLVTVATPNATHFEIASACLRRGFPVLCEKPMTLTVEEAETLCAQCGKSGRLLAVNFGYTGYPMVRQARAMIGAGELGHVRLVVAEFAHGFHAASEKANPRLRWRYNPAEAGVSGVLADAGIHALHMIGFLTGQNIESLSAEFASLVAGRTLEDDAALSLTYTGGTRARLWTSAIAVGQMHGLNIRVFGERGGLAWRQEHPDQLSWTPLDGRTEILQRGDPALYPPAVEGSRIAAGHAEGMLVAFANIYRDIHAAILSGETTPVSLSTSMIPTAADGLAMVRAVDAAARSAERGGERMRL